MQISTEVLTVLSGMNIEGDIAFLPPRKLERKLYEGVNKVLEELGGKWNRYKKGHVFDSATATAEGILDRAILTGEITTHQEMGFFPTPKEIAEKVVITADIHPKMTVLEPSAGDGAIARAVPTVKKLWLIEKDEGRVKQLHSLRDLAVGTKSIDVVEADFLTIASSRGRLVDRVVMNPPFARQQDIDHVMHAFTFLKPKGKLVSIMAAGVLFRENKKTVAFREFIEGTGGTIEELPKDAFVPSGTAISTVMVTAYRAA